MWNYNLAKQYLSDYQWCFVHEKPIKKIKSFSLVSQFENLSISETILWLCEISLKKCYKMEIIINACVEAFRVKVPLCNYARFIRRHNCLLASVAKFWSHLCTGVFDPGRSGVWIVWRCFEFFLVVLSFLTISFTVFLLVTQGLLMIRCVLICFINPVWVITK